ncbi:MAG: CHAD domain-containing protein [Mariprofundus sp.]|nr:CHAD domain-containing protein [Mariprofundus sp.]
MNDKYRHPQNPDTDGAAFLAIQLTEFTCMADLAARHFGSNEDALHDFRVALRCLRSWLKAFGSKLNIDNRVIEDVSSLAAATNRCRDMEVFDRWLYHQSMRSSLNPAPHFMNSIHHQLEQDKLDSIGHINTQWPAIKNRIHDAIKPGDQSNARAAFIHHVQPVLKLRLSKLSDQINQVIDTGESQESHRKLHKCRISIKQIRYLIEPFKTGNSLCKACLHDLKRLQDQLGACHDLFVFTTTLQRAASQFEGIETLIESAEQQRRACFNALHTQHFTPPIRWLERLETAIAMIADELQEVQNR